MVSRNLKSKWSIDVETKKLKAGYDIRCPLIVVSIYNK